MGLDLEQLNLAIETLERHDVIVETENSYRIIVELFRRRVFVSRQDAKAQRD